MSAGAPRPPSRRDRLRASIGPEQVAIALIAIVALGAFGSAAANMLARTGTGDIVGSAAPSVAPTAAPSSFVPPTPVPTATPAPTATPEPTPTPGPSASSSAGTAPSASAGTSPASWAALARTILEADGRLVEAREAIRAEIVSKPTSAADLSRLIRQGNETLSFTLASLDRLAATTAPSELVTRLTDMHQTALDGGVDTLKLALSNVKGFVAGGTRYVGDLESIESLADELAAAAGVPNPIPPVAVPSAGASASAAPTPAP